MLVYIVNGHFWFCLVMLGNACLYCKWTFLVLLGFYLCVLVNETLYWCENSNIALGPQNRNIIGIILLVVKI